MPACLQHVSYHVPVLVIHAVSSAALASTFSPNSLQNHQYHCPRFPVQCPNQCGTPNIAREDLANHVKDNCGSALVLCPFKDAGCKHRVKRTCVIYQYKLFLPPGGIVPPVRTAVDI